MQERNATMLLVQRHGRRKRADGPRKALKDGREKAAQPREMSTTTQLGLRADLTFHELAEQAKDHPDRTGVRRPVNSLSI